MLAAFDVETNIVDGTASPFHADTRIVITAARLPLELPAVIAGHNIGFDILHALKDPGIVSDWARSVVFAPDAVLWCTMIVDYLVHAGRYRSPSLEESCARWGVPFAKDDLITSYFDAGKGADVIIADGHEDRLRAYHVADLRATRELATRQMAHLNGSRLLPVVRTQLEALKLVILEQWSGLPVDLDRLEDETRKARDTLALQEARLKQLVGLDWFNPASNPQVASVLYGGELVNEYRVPVGWYKTGAKVGKPRYRIEYEVIARTRLVEGAGSVNEENLTRISNMGGKTPFIRDFCQAVLEYRETAKLLGTYLEPIAAKVATSFDGRLHGDINMAVTNTGRKSSSGPNLQNIPPVVREVIRARSGWKIVAADFKQLEVVAWAYLSRDKALYADITNGVDIHGRVADFVEKRTGKRPERTNVKRVVFGRIYGGGAETLSAQSGVPVDVVREIIKSLDTLYPTGAKFGESVMERLHAESRPLDDPTSPYPHREAEYELPSGRRLWFRTYDARPAPWKRNAVPVQFSYTQAKNRPVQSFATSDIVPLAESMCLKLLQEKGPGVLDRIKPGVSVHDEIVFEVREDALDELRNLLHICASNLLMELNARFKLNPVFDLALKLEVGVGPSWAEAKP